MADAARGSYEWIRSKAHIAIRNKFRDAFVREVFPDTLIVEDLQAGELYEFTYKIEEAGVSLDNEKKVELTYVAMKRQHEEYEEKARTLGDLTGPVVAKNAAKQLITTVVLVPGETDGQDGPIDADKVEDVANEYMAEWRMMDLEHSFALKNDMQPSAIPVQSWTTDFEEEAEATDGTKMVLPVGTWKIRSKVRDDLWPQVLSGEIAGASIMGVSRQEFDKLRAATKSEDLEEEVHRRVTRVPLSELGDWFCPVISLCKKGQVPKAKIIAMKSQVEEETVEEEKPTFWHRVFGKPVEEPVVESTVETEEDQGMSMTKEEKQEFAELMSETFAGALKTAGLVEEKPVETEEDRRRRETREAAREMLEELGVVDDEGNLALKAEDGDAKSGDGDPKSKAASAKRKFANALASARAVLQNPDEASAADMLVMAGGKMAVAAKEMGNTTLAGYGNQIKSLGKKMKKDGGSLDKDALKEVLDKAGGAKVATKTEEEAVAESEEYEGEESEEEEELDESERAELRRLREQDENIKELFTGDLEGVSLKDIFPEAVEEEDYAEEKPKKAAMKSGKSRATDAVEAAAAAEKVSTKSHETRDATGRRLDKPYARIDK